MELASSVLRSSRPIRLQEPDDAGDWQQIAQGVNGQGGGRACEGHKPPTQRRAHQLAHIEDDRKAGEIGSQLPGVFDQKRAVFVASREFVGPRDAHQKCAGQQHRHLGGAGDQRYGHSAEQACAQQGPLGLHQNALASDSVGPNTGRSAHQECRQRQQSEMQRQQHRVPGAVHQDPALRCEPCERSGGADPRGQ